jgi:hypothetical protein
VATRKAIPALPENPTCQQRAKHPRHNPDPGNLLYNPRGSGIFSRIFTGRNRTPKRFWVSSLRKNFGGNGIFDP